VKVFHGKKFVLEFDDAIIVAFSERVYGRIGSVCAEEFVAKPSFMGWRRSSYRDLCEVREMGAEGVKIRSVTRGMKNGERGD